MDTNEAARGNTKDHFADMKSKPWAPKNQVTGGCGNQTRPSFADVQQDRQFPPYDWRTREKLAVAQGEISLTLVFSISVLHWAKFLGHGSLPFHQPSALCSARCLFHQPRLSPLSLLSSPSADIAEYPRAHAAKLVSRHDGCLSDLRFPRQVLRCTNERKTSATTRHQCFFG
jgi:hypothetical protein